ncbi:MAG TPA: hypothetical protein PKH20_08560, partial [Exilispira sp.]|nr:hypothetical protein [Exilispira sp.]
MGNNNKNKDNNNNRNNNNANNTSDNSNFNSDNNSNSNNSKYTNNSKYGEMSEIKKSTQEDFQDNLQKNIQKFKIAETTKNTSNVVTNDKSRLNKITNLTPIKTFIDYVS